MKVHVVYSSNTTNSHLIVDRCRLIPEVNSFLEVFLSIVSLAVEEERVQQIVFD